MRRGPSVGALALAALGACAVAETRSEDAPLPSPAELVRTYYRARELLVVYGDADPATVAAYRGFAEGLGGGWRARRVVPRPASAVRADELGGRPLVLVGTPRSNPWIARAAPALPVAFDEDGFLFDGRRYEGATDVLRLVHPSPFDPTMPVLLWTGNRDAAIARRLDEHRLGDFEVFRDGRLVAMGTFARSPDGRRWLVEPESRRRFDPPSAPLARDARLVHFAEADLAPAAARRVVRRHRALADRIDALFGSAATEPAEPVRVFLYPSHEDKGLLTLDTRTAHIGTDGAVHVVVSAEDPLGAADVPVARALLRRRLGPPSRELVELGLAVVLADEAERVDGLAARLVLAGEMPRLAALVDEASLATMSPFLALPAAGSFARFLLETEGAAGLLERVRGWSPSPAELERLDGAWAVHRRRRAASRAEAIRRERDAFPRPPDAFLKGFTHAHEGYRIYNGYLSRRSDRALERLAALGTTAVAIVPYTFLRDPHRPDPLPIPTRAGSENDEGVVHAIATAHRLGLTVLLKPQIWLRGSWPGAIEMRTPEDRGLFFEHYTAWIRHYALLAQAHRVPLLAVGVELMEMTDGPDEEWRVLIRRLRRIYDGRLVYAANWYRELEHVTFWDELDYIGVNAYDPLSEADAPTDEELARGFARALERIRRVHDRYGRPVLLTELGFTSTPAPWRNPHEDGRGKPVALEDQARAYEAAFRALYDARSFVRGAFWWKWPSDLRVGGAGHGGFTPNGKPAEEVVRRWYGREW